MKTMIGSGFKARCLKVMDEVAATGEAVLVTKNGVPVGRFVPYRPKPQSLFGLHAVELRLHGNLLEPIDEGWEAAG